MFPPNVSCIFVLTWLLFCSVPGSELVVSVNHHSNPSSVRKKKLFPRVLLFSLPDFSFCRQDAWKSPPAQRPEEAEMGKTTAWQLQPHRREVWTGLEIVFSGGIQLNAASSAGPSQVEIALPFSLSSTIRRFDTSNTFHYAKTDNYRNT